MNLATASNMTPTQRQAFERRRAFRASIAARAIPEIPIIREEPIEEKPKPKANKKPVVVKPVVIPIVWPIFPEPDPQPAWPISNLVTIEKIQQTVCVTFQIPKRILLGTRRDHPVLIPRHIAIYLARILTPNSLPGIGRKFGGLDHSTVLNAVRKIERLMLTDANLAHEVALLIQAITGVQK
jgi:hypothetical protein